jgi:hypothetical protein
MGLWLNRAYAGWKIAPPRRELAGWIECAVALVPRREVPGRGQSVTVTGALTVLRLPLTVVNRRLDRLIGHFRMHLCPF